jgi:transposase
MAATNTIRSTGTRSQTRGAVNRRRLRDEHQVFRVADGIHYRVGVLRQTRAVVPRDLVARIRELTIAANELERRIAAQVGVLAPSVLALPGVGALTTAKMVAETADVRRFRSKDCFARHNGTAPLPVWSGNRVRTLCHGPATGS